MTVAGSQHDLCVWVGPVWSGNLAPVVWSHQTDLLTIYCEGGGTGCATLGYSTPTLTTLLKSHGTSLDRYNQIILASFSAGHGLCDVILQDPASCARICAFAACDSYYTGMGPAIKKGFDAFAARAVAGDALLWTSTSSFPGPGYIASEDAIQPLLAKWGMQQDDLPGVLDQSLKAPVRSGSVGGWSHAFFGAGYAHTEHATVVAPAVLTGWISPNLHGLPVSTTVEKVGLVLGGVAAALAVFFGGRAIVRAL